MGAVAGLQARVEQRAAQLQRDVAALAARKRELLQREAEKELAREAADHLERRGHALRSQADRAVSDVRAAATATRIEHERVVEEIDAQLGALEGVRAAAAAE